MKAWVLKKPATVDERPLELIDVRVPTPREDKLLVRV